MSPVLRNSCSSLFWSLTVLLCCVVLSLQLRNADLLATNTKLESDVAFERERYTQSARKLTAEKDAALTAQIAKFNEVNEKRKEAFMKLHG